MKLQLLALLTMILSVSGFAIAQTKEGSIDPINDTKADNKRLVQEYLRTQDPQIIVQNAEVHASEFGDILGDSTELLNLIAVSDEVVIAEYIYHGTLFKGDRYMRDNMLSPVDFEIPMVSVFQITNGIITGEYVFERATSPYFSTNQ